MPVKVPAIRYANFATSDASDAVRRRALISVPQCRYNESRASRHAKSRAVVVAADDDVATFTVLHS